MIEEASLLPESVAGVPDWLLRPLAGIAREVSGLGECERILRAHRGAPALAEWARGVLQSLDVTCEITGTGSGAAVPETGPAIIVSNHPFGALDALALFSIRDSLRPDLRFIGQAIWQRIAQLSPQFLPLLPTRGKAFQPANARSLREAIRWVRQGHALALFPAPSVAHWQWRKCRVDDPPWSTFPGSVVAASGATVVPIHIEGRNGWMFQATSALCPALRHVWLLRELLNKRGSHVRMIVGQGIGAHEFGAAVSPEEIARGMQRRVRALGAAPR